MKTFLQNILAKIKGCFQKATDETKTWTLIAIKLVEGFKVIKDSPVDDVVIAIVKAAFPVSSPWIDKGMVIIDKYLPTTLLSLKMVNSIANITDKNERLKAILSLFSFSDDVEKNGAYHDFCVKAIYCLADGKLTWSECVYLAQTGYEDFKLGLLK